jgi:hypothetical protein
LSAAIAELESQLDAKVFERNKKVRPHYAFGRETIEAGAGDLGRCRRFCSAR